MRGSQRARDILKAMGEEAFQWFNITVGYGPGAKVRKQRPLSGRQIAQLKKECLIRGEEWPYEHLAPTAQKPIQHPKKWPKGHKHERLAVERQQNISKNMENMEKWIAESKARKRLPDDISPADRFFMSRKQLYNKYVRARPAKK